MSVPRRLSLLFIALLLLGAPCSCAPEVDFSDEDPPSLDERINAFMDQPTYYVTSVIFYAIKLGKNSEGRFTIQFPPIRSYRVHLAAKGDPPDPKTAGLTDLPLVLIWLGAAAVFLTIYFGFVNLRSWRLAVRTVRGRYSRPDDPGQVTHFQALTAALSGTVGLGNIAGVAIAIQLGGPGATVWMILMGLFGMTSKFAECTLGVKYRDIAPNGRVYGGPMHYLTRGLQERGLGSFGSILAVFFALMCIGGSFGGGNMFQINSATDQFVQTIGGENWQDSFFAQNRWIFGLTVAVLVALVILGGIVSIARVTSKLVPFMCGIYVLAALTVVFSNFTKIPEAVQLILQGAIDPQAVQGGFLGAMFVGIKRAAFSNEAGVGSASIAHSAVKTSKPASEGIVALLEPFVDTVVVCTMTALAITITGVFADKDAAGIEMTSMAFTSVLPWFSYILSLAAILFAFSTMISWSYYGQQAWAFLFGRSNSMDILYKLIFCSFIVVGSAMTLTNATDFSDAMIFAMSIPNVIGMYLLLPVIRKELTAFRKHVAEIDGQS